MESDELARLVALLPRIREEQDQLVILHDQCRDYEDGKKLNQIEKELTAINVIETETNDIAKLIENCHRIYENT